MSEGTQENNVPRMGFIYSEERGVFNFVCFSPVEHRNSATWQQPQQQQEQILTTMSQILTHDHHVKVRILPPDE